MAKRNQKPRETSVVLSLTDSLRISAYSEEGPTVSVVEFKFTDDDTAKDLLHAALQHFHGGAASYMQDAVLDIITDEDKMRSLAQERIAKELLKEGV
jgi:hypothetical protein